jgi:virulence factor Mce-like protein
MKRILLSVAILLAAGAFVFIAGGASSGNPEGTYKIEFQNAFGLVKGANFKVAGVPAGTIEAINLDQKTLNAVVTVSVSRSGFGQFHQDATCESRPESLIGEYFVDCDPGSSGPVIKPGGTIPVTHTISTIPADLVQNVMRLPYRERFTLIINELGAAAAARGGDLQAALYRAVPALSETDSLLNVLANDSTTLQNLTRDSNTVITALANNSGQVKRFIDEAAATATDTATQSTNLAGTFQRLPGVLEQLKPALAKLATTVTTNYPVLQNLNGASGEFHRLLTDLPGFSHSARPAIKALGQASVTGKAAVQAAEPTVSDLNHFAKSTPELAQNLAIVLQSLDTQSNAVEPDARSPGGKGFSGLQALLGYVFNQALAINTYGPFGHVLAVDAFFSKMCSPYATPAYIALALQEYGAAYRQCYAWLGPNQPGVNETDPSDPSAPVPDPGGAPPGEKGPKTDARRLTAAMVEAADKTTNGSSSNPAVAGSPPAQPSATTKGAGSSATGASGSSGPSINLGKTIGQILSSGSSTGASAPSTGASSAQAQALLNYLLTP